MVVSFSKGKIYVEAEDVKERVELRGLDGFEESGLREIGYGTFEADPSAVYGLNTFLIPFREALTVHDTFKEWRGQSAKKSPVIIKVGVVKSKIFPGQNKLPTEDLEKACRYFLKAAVNMDKYKDGKWDGYIHLYSKYKREFLTGLLPDVIRVLSEKEIPYSIEYTYDRRPEKQFSWSLKEDFTPDPDQVDAIQAGIEGKRGIIKAPTGFGEQIAPHTGNGVSAAGKFEEGLTANIERAVISCLCNA